MVRGVIMFKILSPPCLRENPLILHSVGQNDPLAITERHWRGETGSYCCFSFNPALDLGLEAVGPHEQALEQKTAFHPDVNPRCARTSSSRAALQPTVSSLQPFLGSVLVRIGVGIAWLSWAASALMERLFLPVPFHR